MKTRTWYNVSGALAQVHVVPGHIRIRVEYDPSGRDLDGLADDVVHFIDEDGRPQKTFRAYMKLWYRIAS